jgi:GTPase involved in cell partitioning and DNA repair
MNELKSYSPGLIRKKIIVSLSKADLFDSKKIKELSRLKFKGIKDKPLIFSSISGQGLNELLDYLWQLLERERE